MAADSHKPQKCGTMAKFPRWKSDLPFPPSSCSIFFPHILFLSASFLCRFRWHLFANFYSNQNTCNTKNSSAMRDRFIGWLLVKVFFFFFAAKNLVRHCLHINIFRSRLEKWRCCFASIIPVTLLTLENNPVLHDPRPLLHVCSLTAGLFVFVWGQFWGDWIS